MSSFRALAAVLVVAFLVSCAGKEFVRVANQDLKLNQTSVADIKNRLGEPQSISRSLKNGMEIRIFNYVYASAASTAGLLVGGASARVQVFKFHAGRLIGYEYTSSFLNDPTGFDGSFARRIKIGETTRQDIVDELGEPVGESVFPIVDAPGDREIIYTFTFSSASYRHWTTTLRVQLGPDDVVKNLSYLDTRPN